MLHHILYLSSETVSFDTNALTQLLVKARANNARAGVSGMLLYAEGNFIQYLEGEAEAVREIFARISRDPRHAGVLTVSEGPAEDRIFPDWSMGFRTLTANERRELGQFDLDNAALQRRIGADAPAILKVMMKAFYEGTHRHCMDLEPA